MATINLGNIKFKWQGAYNAGTAYTVDDVVSYNGSSYICILASTGNLPTNATYWEQMSSAGTNGTDGTDLTTTLTTQGDILYRDGSGLQRLGAGTAGQFLKTLGTGANPLWGDAGGGVLQAVWNANDTPVNTNSGSYQPTNNSVTITPTASDSKILVILSGQTAVDSGSTDPWILTRPYRDIGGGGYSAISNYRRYAPSAGASIAILEDVNHFFIDAPTTTSAVTYKTYFHGGGTSIWFGGRSAGEISRTNAIAIELANGIA